MSSPEPASTPPPRLDPETIAERAFGTERKGLAAGEVRAHLRTVADHVRALQERIGELEAGLAATTPAAPQAPQELDVHQVATLLGEETARVLETAREAANEIRSKAEDNAGRLVREAADEASAARAGAEEYAARLRRESEEEATATRANADRYAAELRRATDAETVEIKERALAEADELRRSTDEQSVATRVEADAYGERVRAEADEYAAAARLAGDDAAQRARDDGETDAARIRAEAEATASSVRLQAAGVLAARTDEAKAVADRIMRDAEDARDRILAEADGTVESAQLRGEQMVREAELVRDRVLRDLARRRKQSKAHLEQLEAARVRLLNAYALVRSTADEATRELNVVLPEARAAAGDALRRAMSDPDPSAAELEAEFAAARDIGLPLVSDAPETSDGGPGSEAVDTEDAESGPRTDQLAAIHAGADPDHVPGADDADVDEHLESSDDMAARSVAVGELPDDHGDDHHGDDHDRRRSGLFGRRRRDRPGVEHGVIVPSTAQTDVEHDIADEPEAVEAAEVPVEPAPVPGAEPTSVLEDASDSDAPSDGELEAAVEPEAGEPAAAPEPEEAEEPEATEPESAPAAEEGTQAIDDLFERIRTSREQAVTEAEATLTAASVAVAEPVTQAEPPGPPADGEVEVDADADAEPVEAEEPVAPAVAWRQHRDEVLAGLEKRLAKRLKRTLADEESGLLDRLRTVKGRPKAEAVLGSAVDERAAYLDVALPLLREAAAEGESNVAAIGAGEPHEGRADTDAATIAGELADAVVELLRPRVERVIVEGAEGDDPIEELELADRVRACYREQRTQRLNDLVRHALFTAFSRGLFDGVPDGTELTWCTDDSGTPCADCADNVLAGSVVRGEPYPTEHVCPPAHPGCRCFLFAAHR
jgi:cell division septum initiation protein DivIVA